MSKFRLVLEHVHTFEYIFENSYILLSTTARTKISMDCAACSISKEIVATQEEGLL